MTKLEICKILRITLLVLDQQYEANEQWMRAMYQRAVETGKKVNGYTAGQLKRQADHYHAMVHTPFCIGNVVDFVLGNKVHFRGTVVDIDVDPDNKPFIIKREDGVLQYAHADQLKFVTHEYAV